MPELPEVETTVRGLRPLLVKAQIKQVKLRTKQLRFPFPTNFTKRLIGADVQSVERRAKYILIKLSTGETLLVHLGMSGRLVQAVPGSPFAKHDHVIITTNKGELRFHDPRRFGIMDIVPKGTPLSHKLLNAIGPEPLDDEFNISYLQKVLTGKSAAIKTLLLDQRIVAGLGNIYVSEALFHARINPTRPGGSLQKRELEKLIPAIQSVLSAAINAGGTSMRDYVQASGELGFFQDHFAAYDREGLPCLACSRPIQRIVQGGRATYFCQKCQK